MSFPDIQAQPQFQLQLESIVYPVLTLPPEITSEIFIHCLPDRREIDVVNPTEAPLLLTHVCGLWRQIAISTPELWAAFDLEIGWPEPNLQQIGETWLKRACQRPLSVKLLSYGILFDIDYIDRFMQTLWGHADDIQALELDISVDDFDAVDTPPKGSGFPMLRKLSVRLPEGLTGPAADYWPMRMFKEAPVLHEAVMGGAPPLLVTLPWHQLTKFTGELYTTAECLQALRFMPNVESCTFAAFEIPPPSSPALFFHSPHVDDLQPVTHPSLKHLTLARCSADYALADSADVLAFLTLPALQTLEIRGVKDFDHVVLDSFLSRSSPPLRSLALHPLDPQKRGTDLCLSSAFTSLPLTHLEIAHPSALFLSLCFACFHREPTESQVLPRLRNLSFVRCPSADARAIVRMAATPIVERAHLNAVGPLQSFRVVASESPVLADAELLPFKWLKASGMNVHIGTEGESLV
ncbi:hypothetical protein DFH06DRAFT_1160904 [Mycena polygramma]|nr:hypothetical protein DFH06DRAFT_1160904 [Mycena polygramma]